MFLKRSKKFRNSLHITDFCCNFLITLWNHSRDYYFLLKFFRYTKANQEALSCCAICIREIIPRFVRDANNAHRGRKALVSRRPGELYLHDVERCSQASEISDARYRNGDLLTFTPARITAPLPSVWRKVSVIDGVL